MHLFAQEQKNNKINKSDITYLKKLIRFSVLSVKKKKKRRTKEYILHIFLSEFKFLNIYIMNILRKYLRILY